MRRRFTDMIPIEFHERAKALGYGDGCGWDDIERAWDEWEVNVKIFAAEQGMTVELEGQRVWGYRDGETYLLAAATDPDDDPMNLWAQAFSRIDCYLRLKPLYGYQWEKESPLWEPVSDKHIRLGR